jgi:hypothetical protein
VVGLGCVGLPLSLQFASSGVNVLGLDVDPDKVKALDEGRSNIKHVSADTDGSRQPASRRRQILPRVDEVPAVIICVPTPLNKTARGELEITDLHRIPSIASIWTMTRSTWNCSVEARRDWTRNPSTSLCLKPLSSFMSSRLGKGSRWRVWRRLPGARGLDDLDLERQSEKHGKSSYGAYLRRLINDELAVATR